MITPFGNQILVEPIERKQMLVSDRKSLCEYGTVIAVGDEVEKIKVGTVIGFTKWGLNEIEINGKTYYFVPEDSRFVLAQLNLS